MDENISELIVMYRKKNKITQKNMAYILGVSQSQISKWENKKHSPNYLRWSDIKRKLEFV